MLGNKIVLTPAARGHRTEGIISGTPKPGVCMQIKAATEPDAGGRFTWEVFDKAGSGAPGLIAVLDYDFPQGKTYNDAYESGKRGFIYIPMAGDELNMLVGDLSGTGATSDFAIGDLLIPQDGTGKLIDATVSGTASYTARPFQVLETYNDMIGDTWLRVMYTGW